MIRNHGSLYSHGHQWSFLKLLSELKLTSLRNDQLSSELLKIEHRFTQTSLLANFFIHVGSSVPVHMKERRGRERSWTSTHCAFKWLNVMPCIWILGRSGSQKIVALSLLPVQRKVEYSHTFDARPKVRVASNLLLLDQVDRITKGVFFFFAIAITLQWWMFQLHKWKPLFTLFKTHLSWS